MHLAITGNIGAGKTTLAEKLAAQLGGEVLYESVAENPYLADFYADMPRWAFSLQVYFLTSRFGQMRRINSLHQTSQPAPLLIQDRTIYEDSAIFARNLFLDGTLSERDYQTYQALFDEMMQDVRPPDLMIYLKASMPRLQQQIRKRGRAFEQSISEDYLASLNDLYDAFAANYRVGPMLVIEVDGLDYVHNPADFAQIVTAVTQRLNG